MASRYSFEPLDEAFTGIRVANTVVTQAANRTIHPTSHLVLGVQLALPYELFVCGARRRWYFRPYGAFSADFIDLLLCDSCVSTYCLDGFDSFLVLNVIESVGKCHVHFLLAFGLGIQCKLITDDIAIAVDAKVFQLVLRPYFFMHSLCPCLVLVVVTYHYFKFFTGASAKVEVSTDLTNWTTVANYNSATIGAGNAFALQNITNNLNTTTETTQDYFKAITEEIEKEYTETETIYTRLKPLFLWSKEKGQ